MRDESLVTDHYFLWEGDGGAVGNYQQKIPAEEKMSQKQNLLKRATQKKHMGQIEKNIFYDLMSEEKNLAQKNCLAPNIE